MYYSSLKWKHCGWNKGMYTELHLAWWTFFSCYAQNSSIYMKTFYSCHFILVFCPNLHNTSSILIYCRMFFLSIMKFFHRWANLQWASSIKRNYKLCDSLTMSNIVCTSFTRDKLHHKASKASLFKAKYVCHSALKKFNSFFWRKRPK